MKIPERTLWDKILKVFSSLLTFVFREKSFQNSSQEVADKLFLLFNAMENQHTVNDKDVNRKKNEMFSAVESTSEVPFF